MVDTGADTFTFCVALTDDSVSGLELIQLANDQHGLQYRFGDGGQAVCMLANVGAEGDDCFGEYPDFWGFWRGDGNGGWTWSGVGAGSTLVRDGDVQGWSWGSGQDGSTHPRPPDARYEEVCVPAAPASDRKDPGERRTRRASAPASATGTTGGGGSAGDAGGGEATGEEREVKEREVKERSGPRRDETEVANERIAARGVASPEPALAAVADGNARALEQDGPGLPATGLLAVALVVALGAGGTIAMRRRDG